MCLIEYAQTMNCIACLILLYKFVRLCTPEKQTGANDYFCDYITSQCSMQSNVFYAPKSISKEKMFGGYFHSLSVHAAILYREVALRSINTELQERMFNSCNNITLTTSNRQANSMLNNILVRVQMESQVVSQYNPTKARRGNTIAGLITETIHQQQIQLRMDKTASTYMASSPRTHK